MPANTLPTYDDWTIAKKHREIILELLPSGMRAPILQRSIPGLINGRFTKDFKAGTYLMPLKSQIEDTFSDRHDVARSTMLVVAEGETSIQSNRTPNSMVFMERIRNRFASRRIMNIVGELYSTHTSPEYDVDDTMSRRLEIIPIVLTTTIREIR